MHASRTLPSESLPTVNLALAPWYYAGSRLWWSGGDPNVVRAKENFVMDERMETGTDRLDGKNSDLDISRSL